MHSRQVLIELETTTNATLIAITGSIGNGNAFLPGLYGFLLATFHHSLSVTDASSTNWKTIVSLPLLGYGDNLHERAPSNVSPRNIVIASEAQH